MIIYPIFLSCREKSIDPFWRKIFEDLAHGRSSHGVSVSDDGYIYSKIKGKEFSYVFKDKDEDLLYSEIMDILTKKFELASNRDKDEVRTKISTFKDKKVLHWGEIRRKGERSSLIINYVIEKGREYSLSLDVMKQLYITIETFVLFKVIESSNIILSDGKITYITGIQFEPGKFTHNFKLKRENCISEKVHQSKYLNDLWKSKLPLN